MRKQWIILVGVLLVGIVAATATSIYLVHSDLATLSREVTSLGERVSAVEERLPPPPSIGGLGHIPGGVAPGASAVPLRMPTLMPPTPSSGSLVTEPRTSGIAPSPSRRLSPGAADTTETTPIRW